MSLWTRGLIHGAGVVLCPPIAIRKNLAMEYKAKILYPISVYNGFHGFMSLSSHPCVYFALYHVVPLDIAQSNGTLHFITSTQAGGAILVSGLKINGGTHEVLCEGFCKIIHNCTVLLIFFKMLTCGNGYFPYIYQLSSTVTSALIC